MFLTYDKRAMDTAGGDGGSASSGGASGGAGTPQGASGSEGNGNSGGNGGGSGASGGLFDDGDGSGAAAGDKGAGPGNGGGADGKGAGAGDGAGVGQNQPAQDWKTSLPDELKNNPSLGRYKDVASLAKAYTHLESLKGSDKISVPKPGTDIQTMRSEVFEKLGFPKTETDYKLELKADGPKVDAEFQKVFQKMAYDNNLLPAQGQALLQWFADANDQAFKSDTKAQVDQQRANLQALRTEWGQAYDQELGKAKAGMKEFLSKEEQAHFSKAGLGTDPAFIKLMNKLGGTLDEAQIREGAGATGTGAMTPVQAQAEIKRIQSDLKGAYYDKNHNDHATAKKQVNRLFSMAFPGKHQPPTSVKE